MTNIIRPKCHDFRAKTVEQVVQHICRIAVGSFRSSLENETRQDKGQQPPGPKNSTGRPSSHAARRAPYNKPPPPPRSQRHVDLDANASERVAEEKRRAAARNKNHDQQ